MADLNYPRSGGNIDCPRLRSTSDRHRWVQETIMYQNRTTQRAHGVTLPTLAAAAYERKPRSLKDMGVGVWRLARDTFTQGYEQFVYVGLVTGDRDNWSRTADSYPAGRYIDPRNAALMYVGYTGQGDIRNPAYPELTTVLAPLTVSGGKLVVDIRLVQSRSLTAAPRGDGSKGDPHPYANQFNYQHEGRWMHSAMSAAVQYLAALQRRCGFGVEIGTTPLPIPVMCQMVRRGEPNQDGQLPSPTPVRFSDLKESEIDPEAYVVLDLESAGEGVDISGEKPVVVEWSCPWRVVAGHVRALNHTYGGGEEFGTIIESCYSIR